MSGHTHSHAHHEFSHNQRFSVAICLNLVYVGVEAVFAYTSNSLALFSDAAHNLSDVVAMLIPWGAIWLATRTPNSRRTYGFGRATVLASLISAVLLILTSIVIAWEAIDRFANPATSEPWTIIVVAGIGVFINSMTAWLFLAGSHSDLNLKGAYLHMVADALVSLGVVVAGVGILLMSWAWLDPLVSLVVALVIVWGTWGLLKESVDLIMDAVPSGIDSDEIRLFLETQGQVCQVHDLHIWAMSTTENALTAHVVVERHEHGSGLAGQLATALQEKFGIGHSTIQVEVSASACDDVPHP